VEVVEVAVTPTNVPLLNVLTAATILLGYADEIHSVLDTMLCARTWQNSASINQSITTYSYSVIRNTAWIR